MSKLVASEHDEQVALFKFADLYARKYPELALMFAIPNGGARNIVVARKLKAEGVKAGVPDIFLPVARGEFHGLFIEMKRRKGGELSAPQRPWIKALQEQGYIVEVCRGFDEAWKSIEHYLGEQ